MSSKRYPEEFKIEAVKQITEKGHSVAEVAARLGTTTHSLYAWIKRYDPQQPKITESNDPSAELAKLKKELQRVTEERDILKRPRCTSQASPNEVRLYSGQSAHMACPSFMFNSGCSSQWLLRMVKATHQ
jgi:transposase